MFCRHSCWLPHGGLGLSDWFKVKLLATDENCKTVGLSIPGRKSIYEILCVSCFTLIGQYYFHSIIQISQCGNYIHVKHRKCHVFEYTGTLAPEWCSGLRHCVSVQEAALQSLVQIQPCLGTHKVMHICWGRVSL